MAGDQLARFGVLCLVRVGDCPAKMPDHEIERLKAMIDGHGYVRLPEGRGRLSSARLRSERRCKITAGPFGGMSGLYAGQSTRERELVLLNLLGGQRPVAIAGNLVVPAERRGALMTREELTALRDAIDLTLALPDSIRELLAQWLAPEASKPNGHDLHPPVPPPSPKAAPAPRPAAPKPHTVKRHDNPAHARAAERKLLAAMRERPGLSSASLAKIVGAGLSTTKERLRRMGAQELIEKAPDGRWRVKAEEPREDEPRPTPPPSS